MQGREKMTEAAKNGEKGAKKGGKKGGFATHGCRETQKQPLPLRRGEGGYRLRQFFYFEGRPLLEWRTCLPCALPEGGAGEEATSGSKAANENARKKGDERRAQKKRVVREAAARRKIDGYYRRLAEGMREGIEDILLPALEKEMAKALAARRRTAVYHLICDARVTQDGGGYFSAVRELRLLRGGRVIFFEREGEIFSLSNGRLLSPTTLALVLKKRGTSASRANAPASDREDRGGAAVSEAPTERPEGQNPSPPSKGGAGRPFRFWRWKRPERRTPRIFYLTEGHLCFCARTPPVDTPSDICHP